MTFTNKDFDVEDVKKWWSEGFENQVSKALKELREAIRAADIPKEMEKMLKQGYWGYSIYKNPFLDGRSAQRDLKQIQDELTERGYDVVVNRGSGEVILTFSGGAEWVPKTVLTCQDALIHKSTDDFQKEQFAELYYAPGMPGYSQVETNFGDACQRL
uniref:Uncharacterized protein n=1 Tax=Marseillevirus LCMAC103 TaxID=2506604 RepID=A0A481YUL5_9VIRU|nr:MAG: hypothetical protein LCMAC103_00490 [Marseillevirus LCMAC103]